MYTKNFLEDFTNFDYVMKMLKSNRLFNHNCHQISLKEGNSLQFDFQTSKLYLIQEGYTKIASQYEEHLVFLSFSKRGEFPLLLGRNDLSTDAFQVTALTDCILWEIDRDYLNEILITEDPRNFVLLNYHIKISRNSVMQLVMNTFSSEERLNYILLFISDKFGVRNADGTIDLPSFITYAKLGELASVSLSHASNIVKSLQAQDIISIKKKNWVLKKPNQIPVSIPYSFNQWI
ncbi:hypothetical protein X560_2383 [Listeria fleischmannii 1991]|uniref:Cyclic nucleotide-binding domain-containing protein n=2 Tax=Listeria fleischmannii TaxID=1069827 RepID=A0A2X3HD49_9LIST|nr:Crp/Fnr family transcriptional regulator [Listeria fleischmannii]EMG28736.1 hypothetical protein LFLEISCH_04115 [Listeria fleischmannii subsp. fleischmannii LU2006-1]KMT58246.1 hypothetical protein X560_2383 [Listeria fleischmannii 1991]SQC70487.1 Uncharacterised protein [Listeria fleischmannii subsp. fleischmannii]